MAAKELLDKMVAQYPAAIAAMALYKDRMVHNLEAPYDILETSNTIEIFSSMVDLTRSLEGEGLDFNDLILDFDDHSFVIRAIDGVVLVLLASRVQRAHLIKIQVGLGVFVRQIAKAIEDEIAAPAEDAVSEPVAKDEAEEEPAAPPKKKMRMYRGVAFWD
ncbi:MAG: hypothetical protein AAF871_12010 [Pseudomonadota bacterium]